jgi:hypothetical protein
MNLEADSRAMSPLASGRWNTALGWTLMLVGLLATAALDPWYFSKEAGLDAGLLRSTARHAQGVMLAMTLLQLAVGRLLGVGAFAPAVQRSVALLTLAGTVMYAGGYTLALWWDQACWAVLAGSLLNFAGFGICQVSGPTGQYSTQIRIVLYAVCFGMLLDFLAGLHLSAPTVLTLELGQYDALRGRMLRLARVAAIALSVLTLLYVGLTTRGGRPQRDWTRRGEKLLVAGAVGMPAILASACFLSLDLKYLLPLPATAVLIGVAIAVRFAWKEATLLETWGWMLIFVSLSVGMTMGLYAFAGPLPTPSLLGEYAEHDRQRSIIAHGYAIFLGIAAIFVARRLSGDGSSQTFVTLSSWLLIAGSLLSVGLLMAGILMPVSPLALAAGPTMACAGIAACLAVGHSVR